MEPADGDPMDPFVAAAIGDLSWPDAMDRLAQSGGAVGAVLFKLEGPFPLVASSARLVAVTEDYLRGGWNGHDERHRGAALIRRNGIAVDDDFITPEQIAKSPYYQEFLARHQLRWFAGLRIGVGDEVWCLSLQRAVNHDAFQGDEMRRLLGWTARLSSAARLAREMQRQRLGGLFDGLDFMQVPALLVDQAGRVVCLNARAEALVGPGLDVRHGRVVVGCPRAQAALDRALSRRPDRPGHHLVFEPIALDRPGQPPLVLRVIRLAAVDSHPFGPGHTLIMVDDLAAGLIPPHRVVRQVWGLTEAEAGVALSIAAGCDIDETARRLGISRETVRSQLKAVFAKTGTGRQSELVALLGRLRTFAQETDPPPRG